MMKLKTTRGRAHYGWLIGIISLTALWWATSYAVGGTIIPSPPRVAVRFIELLTPTLLIHALTSLARVGAAMFLAFLAGLPLGLALGRFRALDRVCSPLVYLLYPVPKIALLPVIMLLFGLSDVSKVIVVFLVLFFQILVSVRDGARSIPPAYFLFIRSLGGGAAHALRYVIMPALLPSLLSALRVGTGTALAVLFFAETFGTRSGLGYFTVESWMRTSYTDMFVGITALGLLGFGIFTLIDLVQKRFCRWQTPPIS
jgi:NitT/TauT family transport system permease protein